MEVRRAAQVVVVIGQGVFGRLVQGLLVEAVFEDGLDRAHRVRPQGEGALGGGFESGVGVGLGQAQDAEAGAVALLGVAPGAEDFGDERGGGGSDLLGPSREALGLLPKSPLVKALSYAQERRTGLEVFLDDPAVAIDTNHLERALRPIPIGKRNWLFASSEVGAQRVGIIQSLLVTCRLHEVDAYTYLIDVLQRISVHPANRAIELTPRM